MSTSAHPSMQRIAELQQFIADFGKVLRVPQLADTGRAENDVEHSFGLALTCWYLADKIAPEMSLEKILKYSLAHDTVEVFAGDTFVFGDKSALMTKSDREDDAIVKLANDWPDFPDLSAHAKGYKNKQDPEARFVFAVDKMLPAIMVNLGEKSIFWQHHKVTKNMMAAEKAKMLISEQVAPYYDLLLEWLTNPDYFYKSDSPTGGTSTTVRK